jgi:uncharacterized protein
MSRLEPQAKGIPAPNPSPRSALYWADTRDHRLSYQRCSNCGFVGLRTFSVCARCLGRDSERHLSAGKGSLYSWTVVWRAPDPSFSVPYAPAVVEMDEGFFMVSAVIGCEIDQLSPGMRLKVEFHEASDEVTLPYFAPDGEL